mgnify:CR=1 FL=1
MTDISLRRAVAVAAALNLAYFGIEFVVALRIGSVSLLADSADFFEDAAVNFLICAALGWTVQLRARIGMVLAGVLLMPGLAFLWTLFQKFSAPIVPEPVPLTLTGFGALAINLFCAFMLARFRHHGGSLTNAAFLSARNDVLANIGIIGAGAVTALTNSIWPDILVGLAIALMNLDAASEECTAAREEYEE